MTPGQAASAAAAVSPRPYAGKSLHDRRAEQRERILLSARDVFATRGYAGAGIEEIVAGARVSRTTFYAFFENKEECLLALFQFGVERLATPVLETVAATATQELTPAQRVRAEVGAVAASLASDPKLARIVLIEIVGSTARAETARAQARDAAAQIIETQLEQYESWQRRTALERRVASLAAMAAIAEPISHLVATGRVDEWESVIDPVSEFVARGLEASP